MAEMPTVFPFIPATNTVHLGPPDSPAANVTVPFTEYVKNAASSEIYPTWGESALRANILAITSYALNRVYTEYYRSRGYDFDFTNSTAIDQAFVPGRSYFENISQLVDEIFDNYIRRTGFIEPLAAKFCNGTTATCEGLSQWGSENLAQQGLNSVEILRYYYGEDIEIVTDAPIRGVTESYPGVPLRNGSTGPFVTVVQAALNRIGQNYPAIPRIDPVDGIFGGETEEAVRQFQRIFSLTADGIVGRSTWYQINRIYVAVTRLAELQSQGQREFAIGTYPQDLSLGDTGAYVEQLQYMLTVLREFIAEIPPVTRSGVFDIATADAVRAFQRFEGLPVTGAVNAQTWDTLYEQVTTVEEAVSTNGNLEQFPGQTLTVVGCV